jgi:peptidoglycan/LPS O-acetylase OafA/YrhL
MDSLTVKVEQMIAREVRAARGWLLAVAVGPFIQQMLVAYNLPPKIQDKQKLFVIVACAQFAVFFGLWLLSRTKPKHSLIAALAVYCVLQLVVVVLSPADAFPGIFGILLRLAFTLALIGGISAAYRAEELERNRQTPETLEVPDGG